MKRERLLRALAALVLGWMVTWRVGGEFIETVSDGRATASFWGSLPAYVILYAIARAPVRAVGL